MTRSTTDTLVPYQPTVIGALMLGAALTILPLTGFAQTAAPPQEGAAATAPAGNAQATAEVVVTPASPDAATTDAASTAPADGSGHGMGTVPDANAPAADASASAQAAAGSGTDPAAPAQPTAGETVTAASGTAQAAAVLQSADGTEHGSVTLSDTPSGALHVILHLSALPDGPHAIHIHETGKCEGPGFESAGGHLAGGKSHGVLHPEGMHLGDLPNVDAADGGAVNQEFFVEGVTIADVMDDDGGAFIVHAGTDDYVSQPAGNAGDRIACGVFAASAPTN